MTMVDWIYIHSQLTGHDDSQVLNKLIHVQSISKWVKKCEEIDRTYSSCNAEVANLVSDVCAETISIDQWCRGVQIHKPLLISTGISNRLCLLAKDRGLLRDMTPLYETLAVAQQQVTDRKTDHRWMWNAIYLHLVHLAHCIHPPKIPLWCVELENLDQRLYQLVKDIGFSVSRYAGELFTVFCHLVLCLYHFSSTIPHNVAFIAHCYLLVLQKEFCGVFPLNWITS
jgi:hypothetical protein